VAAINVNESMVASLESGGRFGVGACLQESGFSRCENVLTFNLACINIL
jgi:hypothetical protein